MKTALLYHKDLKNYDLGPAHPFSGDRFGIFWYFFKERFAAFNDNFEIIQPQPASDEDLQLVHTKDYIEVIKEASLGKSFSRIVNYVSQDNLNPLTGKVPEGIESAARLIVGSTLAAAELVAAAKFKKAIGVGGGLHHAKPSFGEGFCFYNDIAVCVKVLKKKYNLKRIFVLDTDAHAGNGTAEIFYNDPEVLFVDIHQDPRTVYPGTGFINEIGKGKGEGFTVNIPLLPGTAWDAYQYVFEEIVFPLAREFRPQVFIRYGGSDPHYLDELTVLGLTIKGFKMLGALTREIAREVCEGKVVDFVTSGYNLEVLPYAWSALISGLLDLEIDLSTVVEKAPPSSDYQLSETKDIVAQLKKILKKYWSFK